MRQGWKKDLINAFLLGLAAERLNRDDTHIRAV
jgi:hypothetical protein